MFVVGGLPLLLLPTLWGTLRESEAFRSARAALPSSGPGLLAEIASVLSMRLRRRFLGLSALWFVINFASAATMSFFTWYVLRERGWNPTDLRVLAPVGLLLSFGGYVVAGLAMDRIGRRRTALIYLLGAIAAAIVCYRSADHFTIAACYVLMQALQGIWPVAYVYTSELFPTELRAAASGLANNLLGRWGQVIAPAMVGTLAGQLGTTGAAVVPLALVSALSLPILLWVLPETAEVREGATPAS
jgi:putative MFS transporter